MSIGSITLGLNNKEVRFPRNMLTSYRWFQPKLVRDIIYFWKSFRRQDIIRNFAQRASCCDRPTLSLVEQIKAPYGYIHLLESENSLKSLDISIRHTESLWM